MEIYKENYQYTDTKFKLTLAEALAQDTQNQIRREMFIADFKHNLKAMAPRPLSDEAIEPYVKVLRTQLNSFIAVQYSDVMEILDGAKDRNENKDKVA